MSSVKKSIATKCLVLTVAVMLSACQTPVQDEKATPLVTPVATTTQQINEPCPPEAAKMTREEALKLRRSSKDRGVLYTLTKNGSKGYLFGTIHISRRDWIFPGPKTLAALIASNTLALELNVFDPQVQKKMSTPAPAGTAETSQVPANFDERIEKIARRVCAPLEQLRRQRASLLLPALIAFDARFEGFEAGYGSESMLYGFASKREMLIKSLETVEQQLAVLQAPKQGEQGASSAVARVLDDLESGKSRKGIVALGNAWASGDLRSVNLICPECTPEKMKRINDDRNPGLAAGIDKLLSSGKIVFAGIGMLHMTGPKALPKLFREMGYKVERVKF